MQWRRSSTTIISVQMAVSLAVLLGVQLYIEPILHWRHLWRLLSLVAFQAVLTWLIISAPWSARLTAIGFVLGSFVELATLNFCDAHDLIRYTPGNWTPEGWYPLALPAERLLAAWGWSTFPSSPLPALLIGMVASGLIGGVIFFVAQSLWQAAWGKFVASRGK